jgi:membrane-bound lytic murein transglycosylase A
MLMSRRLRRAVVAATVIAFLLGPSGHGAARPRVQLAAPPLAPGDIFKPSLEPLKLPDSALEPLDWSALDGWTTDDHSAAFATFLASCRPPLKTILPRGEMRSMYLALTHVCRQAVVVGRLAPEQARIFFERNFRPLRISKLGDTAGFLTGYYEPIVDGSRFPTGIFKVPIYHRPRDLNAKTDRLCFSESPGCPMTGRPSAPRASR